ncbi:hypothetical protein [Pedobacter insulae]|nr:hypothetical protein [Pedobacter insulae]
MNWGWDGRWDGWFGYDKNSWTPGGVSAYNNWMEMVTNITP